MILPGYNIWLRCLVHKLFWGKGGGPPGCATLPPWLPRLKIYILAVTSVQKLQLQTKQVGISYDVSNEQILDPVKKLKGKYCQARVQVPNPLSQQAPNPDSKVHFLF